jgi:hypothetical protein
MTRWCLVGMVLFFSGRAVRGDSGGLVVSDLERILAGQNAAAEELAERPDDRWLRMWLTDWVFEEILLRSAGEQLNRPISTLKRFSSASYLYELSRYTVRLYAA